MRFPEFQGEWKWYNLEEIATLHKGSGISKEQLSKTGLPCILYGEIYTKYKSEVIQRVLSYTNINTNSLVKSKENDVIIPSSGESANDIATARCVPFSDILLGGDLNIIRLYNDNGSFLSYQMNGVRKYDIAKVAQGVSVVHLYGNKLNKIKVSICPIEEQKKIATFLSLIDKRIETQMKIIEKLESLIKGLNDKMLCDRKKTFPRLRYLEFTEEWKYNKIGDILKIGNGKDYKHLNKGNIPVFGTGGNLAYVDDFLYNGESVCIGRKGTINNPFFYSGKFWTVDTLFYTYSFKDVIPKFSYYLFNRINWMEYNEASGVPSLSKSTIKKISVSIPSIKEQKKIISILSSIDNKIKVEKNILFIYQKQKAYLLKQMFI